MKVALLFGTFDPCTNGHLWLVAKSIALDLFDRIIVGVIDDPARKTLFTLGERMRLWRECAEMLNAQRIEVVVIKDEPPVVYAKFRGCRFLLRGIRSVQDYHDELRLQQVNQALEPTVQAVYLMPDAGLAGTSSALVKQMIGKPGWKEDVKRHVPVGVWEALLYKAKGTKPPG